MENANMILVIGDVKDGEISLLTREALTLGRQVAVQTDRKIQLILLGNRVSSAASQGFQYGADLICVGEDDQLSHYIGEIFQAVLAPEIQRTQPTLVIMPHNEWGLDLAPRLAFQLNATVLTDCENIQTDGNSDALTFIKPVFGGKATQAVRYASPSLQFVTIREGAVAAAEPDVTLIGDIEKLNISKEVLSSRVTFIKKEIDENLTSANQLQGSNIVIAVGRGIKNSEGVGLAQKAANLFQGGIAASRPVVDSGWLSYSLQVGLSGKKVHPQLYIAAGVSGAIQHMVGCVKSGTVVAINNDENAPVFQFSKYGIVGDCQEVLSGLINELEQTQ